MAQAEILDVLRYEVDYVGRQELLEETGLTEQSLDRALAVLTRRGILIKIKLRVKHSPKGKVAAFKLNRD